MPFDETTFSRYSVTATSVGAALIEVPFPGLPDQGRVRYVTAEVTAGTAINQVAFNLRETTSVDAVTDLSYALGAQPLKSEEDFFYKAGTRGPAGQGTMYAAVRVDNATTDHTVVVTVTIER